LQERFQDQCRGHLVDNPAMLLAFVTGLVEDLVSLAGGEPFIPHMDRQTSELAELSGKGLRLLRLRTGLSIEMDWVADDNCAHGVLSRQPRQRTEIFTGAAFALKGHDRLRREAKLI
jgi:hypothetical protein